MMRLGTVTLNTMDEYYIYKLRIFTALTVIQRQKNVCFPFETEIGANEASRVFS